MVINCGSSSVKFRIIDPLTKKSSVDGNVERIGSPSPTITFKHDGNKIKNTIEDGGCSYAGAFNRMCKFLETKEIKIGAFGHRVVHGGEIFPEPVVVDDNVMQKIKSLSHLAPLHNPSNLLGMEFMAKMYPVVPQVAVFDTSYHLTMPEVAHRYPIPEKYKQIRKFGFHGLSNQYVVRKAANLMGKHPDDFSIIVAHLGNGCSVTATKNGRSMDTSMGFSPLEGLMMGQRSGDIDPTVIKHFVDFEGLTLDEAMEVLNSQSGLLGIAGSGDSRDVEDNFLAGDPKAKLAIDIFCHRLAKYIGSYAIVGLGGCVDCVVFTGGIGEKSFIKRAKTIELLRSLGLTVDDKKNAVNGKDSDGVISKASADPVVMVVPTNEELIIAEETFKLVSPP